MTKKKAPAPLVKAKTQKQQELIDALHDKDQILAVGPAGTGKTFIATAFGVDFLKQGDIKKLILIRPAIGADEDLGFLPGSMNEKMEPWMAPFLEVIKQRTNTTQMNSWIKQGDIEIAPITYMRGRTFSDAMIIVDEAQNATLSQLRMILTRVGENSIVVVTGDPSQSDIGGKSGLNTIIKMAKKMDAAVIEFENEDVVRSGVCRLWIEAFQLRGIGITPRSTPPASAPTRVSRNS